MTNISLIDKKKELRYFLRNSDIFTISQRGVTTTIDTFSGDNIQTSFTLTNSGFKNARSVTVDSVTLTYGKDYTTSESVVNNNTQVDIEFTTAPATGTNNISVQYDHGTSGDKIYDDFPQDFVSIDTFPRVGFDIITSTTQELALGGEATQNNMLISIIAYGIGKEEAEQLIDTIRTLFINNKNNFFYWNFITPDSNGPLLVSDVKGGKVFQRSLDLRAEFEFEGTTC